MATKDEKDFAARLQERGNALAEQVWLTVKGCHQKGDPDLMVDYALQRVLVWYSIAARRPMDMVLGGISTIWPSMEEHYLAHHAPKPRRARAKKGKTRCRS